jgi:hypothetical protein
MGLAALLGAAAAAGPARAQVFSPGELLRGHAALDTLTACAQCHAGEKRLDPEKCLACHTPIRDRVQKREGYHGAPGRAAQCETCHPDHAGRGAPGTRWPMGKPAAFPHRDTGWALQGAHATLACDKCHDARHVSDPAVRRYNEENGNAATYLGVSRACASCHFDEHRGELGTDCARCHDQAKWTPAPAFTHAKTWQLAGAHETTACGQCHPTSAGAAPAPGALPAPRAATYVKMKPLAHAACTDCHADPHRDLFGRTCEACHTETNWTGLTPAGKAGFHDKTAYRLEGRHREATCAACHPANAQGKKLWRPIAHQACGDCHPNAHPDLRPAPPAASGDCADCHTVDGFLPARYAAAEHESARYPLREAHRAVACPACHVQAMGKPLKAESKRVADFLAPLVISPWRLREKDARFAKCGDCHASGHRDQFAARDCADCHEPTTWARAARFAHDQSPYRLDGRHRQVACRQCHAGERDAAGAFVRYRPLPADCEACHADPHYGQFRLIGPRLSCARCHDTGDFKKTRFSHQDAALTGYPLRGAHAKTACDACHAKVRLAAAAAVTDVVRYRPTPAACELCHADEHQGKYREASRLLRNAEPQAGAEVTAGVSRADPWAPPPAWFGPLRQNPTRCTSCHAESAWADVRYSHETTGFPLRGSHAAAACEGCHRDGAREAPPRSCAGCHADPHGGALGARCAECHDETDFGQPAMPLARHAQTSFPLEGAHAIAPCAECHRDAAGPGFRATPRECVACHANALPAASARVPSHAGFSLSCGQCHTPVDWRAASYRTHDRCFPIGRPGNHAGFACRDCHLRGVPAVTGTCADSGVSCIACHGTLAGRHKQVNGYEARDRKCYECHPGGAE